MASIEEIAMLSSDTDEQKKKTEVNQGGERFKPTVEPVLFCFTFASVLGFFAFSGLRDKQICMSHFDEASCSPRQGNPIRVQDETWNVVHSETTWYWTIQLSLELVSTFFCIFYSSLCDHVSRKLTILLPTVGALFSTVSNLIQAALNVQIPVGYLFIGTIASSLSGGWITCNMASFSYLSDVTSFKSRTSRIVVAEICIWAAAAIAFSLSTFPSIMEHTGFLLPLFICLVMYALAAIFTVVLVKDCPSSQVYSGTTCEMVAKHLCRPISRTVMDIVQCVTKERTGNARNHLLLCLLVLITGTVGTLACVLPYLDACHQPSAWDFSMSLNGILFCETFAILSISMLGLEHVPRINRLGPRSMSALLSYLVFTAGVFIPAAFLVRACNWLLLVVPVVQIAFTMGYTVIVTSKSLLSKLVETQELGRIFAVHGVIQVTSVVVGYVLYYTLLGPANPSLSPGSCSQIVGSCILILSAVLTCVLGRDLHTESLHAYVDVATSSSCW